MKLLPILMLLLIPKPWILQTKINEKALHNDWCGEWIKDPTPNSHIFFQWCKNDYNIYYHFRNDFDAQIHIYCRIIFTDGYVSNEGIFINGNSISNDESAAARIPKEWLIKRKEYQDSNGKWIPF